MLSLQISVIGLLSHQLALALGNLRVHLVLLLLVPVNLRLDPGAFSFQFLGQLLRGGDHLVQLALGCGSFISSLLLTRQGSFRLGFQLADFFLHRGQASLGVAIGGVLL